MIDDGTNTKTRNGRRRLLRCPFFLGRNDGMIASRMAIACFVSAGILWLTAACKDRSATGPVYLGDIAAEDVSDTGDPVSIPFPMHMTGLPTSGWMCANGLPNYLDADQVRAVADRVFREAGFRLEPGYRYEREGVVALLDGYDDDERAGYVFLYWGLLGPDAYRRSTSPPHLDVDRHRRAEWLDHQKGVLAPRHRAAAERVLSGQEGDFDDAYRGWLETYEAECISLDEVRLLSDGAVERRDFVAVISIFDDRYHWWGGPESCAAPELLALYEAETDPVKKETLRQECFALGARPSLDRLAQDLRDYIGWARKHGLGTSRD